jgi:hypothetical protein
MKKQCKILIKYLQIRLKLMSVDSKKESIKRDYEKELNLLKAEYIKFLNESNELDQIYKRNTAEL